MLKYIFKPILLVTVLFLLQGTVIGAQKNFGNLAIKIDDKNSQDYPIQRALLYRQVNVGYDSTVLVQNKDSQAILYYPQLDSGNENVLRLIVGEITKQKTDFFDIFINLGDTIPDTVFFKNDTGKILLARNGRLGFSQPLSKNINGTLQVKSEKEKMVAGQLDLNFTLPDFLQVNQTTQINFKGSFEVAVGDYRELTLGTTSSDKDTEKKRKRNIYLAVIFSAFLIAIFGLR